MLEPLEVLADGVDVDLRPAGVLLCDRLCLSLTAGPGAGIGDDGGGGGAAVEAGTASAAPGKP